MTRGKWIVDSIDEAIKNAEEAERQKEEALKADAVTRQDEFRAWLNRNARVIDEEIIESIRAGLWSRLVWRRRNGHLDPEVTSILALRLDKEYVQHGCLVRSGPGIYSALRSFVEDEYQGRVHVDGILGADPFIRLWWGKKEPKQH